MATRDRRWSRTGPIRTPLPPTFVRTHQEVDLHACPASIRLNKDVPWGCSGLYFPQSLVSEASGWELNLWPTSQKREWMRRSVSGLVYTLVPTHLHQGSGNWYGAEPLSPLVLVRLKYVVGGRVISLPGELDPVGSWASIYTWHHWTSTPPFLPLVSTGTSRKLSVHSHPTPKWYVSVICFPFPGGSGAQWAFQNTSPLRSHSVVPIGGSCSLGRHFRGS